MKQIKCGYCQKVHKKKDKLKWCKMWGIYDYFSSPKITAQAKMFCSIECICKYLKYVWKNKEN